MAEALVKKSTIAVKKETGGYGVDPVVTSADCIRVKTDGININDNYDLIEIDEIRNTFSEHPPLRGLENTGGDLGTNLRGANTAGVAPEADVLWECAIGVKNLSTATTTDSGCGSTSLIVISAAGFAVGDAVRVANPTPEIVWVTEINSNTLTVSPALAVTPGAGVAVGAGAHYKMSNAELASFWLTFWRGDITREDYAGNKIESMEMDINTGSPVSPKFTFKGKTATYTATGYTLGTATYVDTDPLVGLNQSVKIAGISVACDRFMVRIANELYPRKDITSTGIAKQIFTGRRVEGSFSVLYEDKTIYDTFKADTEAEAIIILSRASMAAGQIVAIRIPKLRYVNVPVGVDSKIFKYDVSFRCDMTAGDDEVTSFSWL